jgi:hypothetical protein
MGRSVRFKPLFRVVAACFLAVPVLLPAQAKKPLPLNQGVPGVQLNHRLILKDGTYQIVRKYEIVGDRVRYISLERGGDWEELPSELVDWDATKKWERDHTNLSDDASPAMREAAKIDEEESAERQDEMARSPEVAPGLELPDEDTVFVLDTFHGTPELVELKPNNLAIDARTHHGLSVLNPLAGSRQAIELEGRHARIHLHVNDPAIYLSLNVADDREHVLSHATTVDTSGAKPGVTGKHGAQSAKSGFAIVRVDERNRVRIIGAIHVSRTGEVTQDENVIPTRIEVLPGKHWIKVIPNQPLLIGEYALVEILSPSDISQTVWDFNVNPMLGDNPGSIGPILKQASEPR